MRYYFIISLLLLIPLVSTRAQSESLIFTEIMYDVVGTDEGFEWVEIYNGGDSQLVWSDDWRFYDGSSHLVTISQGNGTIGVGEAFVIADKADKFLLHYP
ncbi:MAG: hypothetical protein NUV82_03780, partial [Candidatus Komeilibacteria bacterium]|nr:hypothetical protein [Candidatus Komeilibacteria bacterium]